MTGNRRSSPGRNFRNGVRDKPYYYDPNRTAGFVGIKKTAQRRRIILTVLLLASVAFVIGMVFLWFFSSFFNLKSISVTGLSKHSEEEIIAVAAIETGPKIYSVDSKAAEKKLLSAYPELADVTVKKVLPDEIVIELTYEEPKYFICITDEYFTLSESLRVIERSRERKTLEAQGLILVEFPNVKRAVTGEKIEFFKNDEVYISEILEKLDESYFGSEINRVYIRGKFDIDLVKVGEYRIEIGDYNDCALKLKMAEKIMDRGGYRGQSGLVLNVSDVSESSAVVHKTLKIE